MQAQILSLSFAHGLLYSVPVICTTSFFSFLFSRINSGLLQSILTKFICLLHKILSCALFYIIVQPKVGPVVNPLYFIFQGFDMQFLKYQNTKKVNVSHLNFTILLQNYIRRTFILLYFLRCHIYS